MKTQTLQAEVREGRGKGPARQLRMTGRIPAVFYGQGVETKLLSISPKELLKALETEHGRNVVFKLGAGGSDELAMVKEIQVHPVDRRPVHVDFYRVSGQTPVEIRVPFEPRGRAVGVQKGGKVAVVFRDLPIRTTPERIPALITVDVSELDIGGTLSVQDLSLPEGVKVLMAPTRRVVLVSERKVIEEEPKAEAGAEGDAAAGEAAAGDAPAPTDKKT